MNMPDEDAWIERASALLDRSADDLDAATLSRLNRARQAALAERHAIPRVWAWRVGFAAAAVALFGVGLSLHHRVETNSATPIEAPLQAGDIDFLGNDDETLDLSENLDFYAWLESHRGDPSG